MMKPSIMKVTRIFQVNLIVVFTFILNAASSVKGEPFAYVANSTSNTVSVIDTANNTVEKNIELSLDDDGPIVVAITPNGAFAYVTNFNSGTVSVISTATNEQVDSIAVGTNPKGIIATPDGAFVYVANRGSGNVSVIDTDPASMNYNTVVDIIDVGQARAHELDITFDGAFVYVTTSNNNADSGKLSVIKTEDNTVVNTVPIGVFPVGVAVTPDQSLVYAVNNISNTVSVIETATNTVVTIGLSGAARPEGVAITPDGTLAYVTQTSLGSVVVISTVAPYAIVATVSVSLAPIDVAFTPDDTFAYVTNQGSDTVSVINVATNSVAATVEVQDFPRGVAITPLPVDQDEDGLTDDEEIDLGTDPNDPDTDDDGLFDGTEVDMAQGSGCPDPLDSDSDDDTLTDGEEVVTLGTMPCNPDSDGDGIPDSIDPFPLDPEGTSGFIEDELRNLGEEIVDLDISLIDANNQNAAQGRINALSNKANAAANAVSDGDIEEALGQLNSLLQKVDGDPQPKDWLVDSVEKDLIAEQIANLIVLLELL